jgi:5'-methylthioadenosine phosphorylase/purine-nucleoside phosphorylase
MSTPIHIHAKPGDFAPAVLCPGDPRRAEYIAKTFFDSPRCVNEERGMLGFTGTFEGKPISVQASGMGCPSAAIVYEELVMLGAERLIRVGTCGALQPTMQMGDVVIAVSSTPQDRTALSYVGGDPHAPTADWLLVEKALAAVRAEGLRFHVGPIVSSDVFYDRDTSKHARWAERGHYAVEMEASVLYTIAALRKVSSLAVLAVSDYLYTGKFERIGDDELRQGVDRMTLVAARVAVSP